MPTFPLMKVLMQCLLAATVQNTKKMALLTLLYCLLMTCSVQNNAAGCGNMLRALLKNLSDWPGKNIANATFGR
ncbi:hypothetical protein NUF91_001625 [Yersinia enterocolitica]|nr:hypothetical protein [Yersinia enterocolitica]